MNSIDVGIVILLLSSASLSVFRGLVKEAYALFAWLISLGVTISFIEELAYLLTSAIPITDIRLGTALTTLFLITFTVMLWVNSVLTSILREMYLTLTERLISTIFGLTRGAILVTFTVMLAGLTQLPTTPWWNESLLIGNFQIIAIWLCQYLPSEIATQFVY